MIGKYTPEQLLDKVREVIETYNISRLELSDAELADLRAHLAIGTYLLVETNIQPAYTDMTIAAIAAERAEGTVFRKYYNALIAEGKSPSLAETLARKDMKTDEEYLEAVKQADMAKQYAYLLNKLLDQANQVLNSMSRKSRV